MGITVPFQLPFFRSFLAAMAIAALVLPNAPAWSQVGGSGMITEIEAQRGGLHRKWFTQLQVNQNRGGLSSLRMHTSDADIEKVFMIRQGEDRYYYSERDRDNLGRMLGEAGARELANERIKLLEGTKPIAVLEERLVPATTVYGVSTRGVVHAINGETGKTVWSQEVGNPEYPTTAVAANDTFVAAVNGSTLYVLDAPTGKYVWDRKLRGAVGAAPAMTKEHVFVPLLNGMIEVFDLVEHKQPTRIYVSAGRALLQPITTETSIIWPTDRGYLYVARNEKMGMRFRLEAKDTIVSKATYRAPDLVFTAAVDGFVYCVHEMSGDILWRFSTGEPISHMPICVGDFLYVITDDGNMFKLDAKTGEEMWFRKGIERFISSSNDQLYCVDRLGRLCILRAETGSRVATLNAQPDLVYPNQVTDRLYIATADGVIQCLCEEDNRLPIYHGGIGKVEANDRPEVELGGGEDPMQPMDPMDGGGNPFGNPEPDPDPMDGGGNPFGGGNDNPFGGGNDNPFGAPMDNGGGDDNPFGGGNDAGDDDGGDDTNPFGAANPFG